MSDSSSAQVSAQSTSPSAAAANGAQRENSSPEPLAIPKTRRRLGFFSWLVIVSLILGLGLWAAYSAWRQSLATELDARIADLRAQGEPIWFADLEPAPVPEADNGAKDYYRAMRAYGQIADGITPQSAPGTYAYMTSMGNFAYGDFSRLTPAQQQEILLMLQENAEVLEAARRAINHPQLHFAYQYAATPFFNMPEIDFASQYSRILVARTAVLRTSGDVEAAIDSLFEQFQLHQALRSPETLVVVLRRRGYAVNALGSLRNVLAAGPLTDEQFQRLDARLAELEAQWRAQPYVIGERCLQMTTAEHPEFSLTSNSSLSSRDGLELRAYPILDALRLSDELQILEDYSRLADLVDETGPDANARFAEFEAAIAEADFHPITSPTSQLPTLLRLVSLGLRQKFIDARLAMRVSRYYHANGRLPRSLEEVTDASLPEVRPGLLSQRPLAYVTSVQPDEFSIYDVGIDGIDQQGAEQDEKSTLFSVLFAPEYKVTPR